MAPKIENLKEEDGKMTVTISNIDVSYVNGLRRTILADIPIICFKTAPYEENKAKISINTTRLNNEIVKQRLSCIPICTKDFVKFDELSNSEKSISICGRVMAVRGQGAILFVVLQDGGEKFQTVLKKDELPEDVFSLLFLGELCMHWEV
jgi:lysyl-tRNA synthetase class II